jgi:hypothetical protein
MVSIIQFIQDQERFYLELTLNFNTEKNEKSI